MPKVYLWDLETGYQTAVIWDLLQNQKYISHTNLQSERYIMTCAIKELDKEGISLYKINDYPRFWRDPTDDREVVERIRNHLENADALIAHNGDQYDIRFLNARLLYWGYDPLPPIITIDTRKIAKKEFRLNSNSLDYIAKFLRVGAKQGISQKEWIKALAGDGEAVDTIGSYNIVDVEVLEKVYKKLAPYTSTKLNRLLFTEETEEPVCPLCGSDDYQRRGHAYTRTGRYQRYQCNQCSSWFQDTRHNLRVGAGSK